MAAISFREFGVPQLESGLSKDFFRTGYHLQNGFQFIFVFNGVPKGEGVRFTSSSGKVRTKIRILNSGKVKGRLVFMAREINSQTV